MLSPNNIDLPNKSVLSRKGTTYTMLSPNNIDLPTLNRQGTVYSPVPTNQVNLPDSFLDNIVVMIDGKKYGLHPIHTSGGRTKRRHTRKRR